MNNLDSFYFLFFVEFTLINFLNLYLFSQFHPLNVRFVRIFFQFHPSMCCTLAKARRRDDPPREGGLISGFFFL